MALNKAQRSAGAEILQADMDKLRTQLLEAGSYPKLEKELGVNRGTLWRFIEQGKYPGNDDDCEKMGITRPLSQGAVRYRRRSERAKAKGWKNWNEFGRYVEAGVVELPEKPELPDVLVEKGR